MKDLSRTVEIDGKKYSIDATFDGSPAIYQHEGNGECHHIDKESYKTRASSLTAGNDDFVIIIARKM